MEDIRYTINQRDLPISEAQISKRGCEKYTKTPAAPKLINEIKIYCYCEKTLS